MADSECSEDYDGDMFFEGADVRKVPDVKTLVAEQVRMRAHRNDANTAEQISQHPNQMVSMMGDQQQQELLGPSLQGQQNQLHP